MANSDNQAAAQNQATAAKRSLASRFISALWRIITKPFRLAASFFRFIFNKNSAQTQTGKPNPVGKPNNVGKPNHVGKPNPNNNKQQAVVKPITSLKNAKSTKSTKSTKPTKPTKPTKSSNPAVVNVTNTSKDGYKAACVVMSVFDKATSKYYSFAVQEPGRGNNFFYGRVKVPGGEVDKSDKNAEAAALREFSEETGLDVYNLPKGANIDGQITLQDSLRYVNPNTGKNVKVAMVHVPLVVDNAADFIKQFSPTSVSSCTAELCGGQYYLINQDVLNKGSYLDTNDSRLINRVICERNTRDKGKIIANLSKLQTQGSPKAKAQVNQVLNEFNIAKLEQIKSKRPGEIAKLITRLNYLQNNNRHTRAYNTGNRKQLQKAINNHQAMHAAGVKPKMAAAGR